MNRQAWERWLPAAGIVFVVLQVIQLFLPPKSPPEAKDLGTEIAAFYSDHRSALLIAAYLGGIGLIAFVVFATSLVERLRSAGEGPLARMAAIAAAALVGVALVADTINYALAWRIADDTQPDTVKAIWEIQALFFSRIWFVSGALILAVALAAWRSRAFPLWYSLGSVVVALWGIVSGAALRPEGFFSPGNFMDFIAYILFLLWVLATSVLTLLRPEGVVAPAPTASMPPPPAPPVTGGPAQA